ncbi:MAG: hypothetical protein JXR19_02175 [Bacteroidia bacterium]
MLFLGTPNIDFGIPDWIIPSIIIGIYIIYYAFRKIQARYVSKRESEISIDEYPEILELQELYHKHSIEVIPKDSTDDSMHLLEFNIENDAYLIYVQDEYDDLKINNPLLHFELILIELALYQDSEDYLQWCKWQGLNASTEMWRDYYQKLEQVYKRILLKMGTIKPCINSMDFELNAGAAQAIRLHSTQ